MLKNKKIIVLMLFVISLCMNVSWVSADKSDCGVFATMSYNNSGGNAGFKAIESSRGTDGSVYAKFLTTEQQLAIIDKESLSTAMLNLKKYCCEKGIGGKGITDTNTCANDKEFYNDNVIDSPYLFDHLFDVIMRRLSGLTGEYDIYTKTNMSGDNLGLEWRAWLDGQAENVSGANPQIIIDKYKEFWQPSPPQSGYDIAQKLSSTFGQSDEDFLKYVSGQGNSEDSEQVAQALKDYDNWTLYDRYNNACAITQYLYALLDLGVNSEDKIRTVNNLARGSCNQIVKTQIENENSYVKLVILQAGNLFLQNYRQGYIAYLYDRSKTLIDTWRDISDKFLDVARGVPHLVHTTVK